MIPKGLGLSPRDNASLRAGWALVLAGVGWLTFGADSPATVLLWLPLLGLLSWSSQCFACELANARIICAERFSILAVALGPFTIRRNPVKVRFNIRVPLVYFVGRIFPNYPKEAPPDDAVERESAHLVVFGLSFLGLTIAIGAAALFSFPALLTFAIITYLIVTALKIAISYLLAARAARVMLETGGARRKATYRVLHLLENGRASSVTIDDIRDLTSLRDGSPCEMHANLLAYGACAAQGEAFLAANHIRRAVELADLARRNSQPVSDDQLSLVYQEAAFVAAAYAGDVDYALRAMAVGREWYLDPTAYHKAMAAIWIRQGNREEAARSLGLAEKEMTFWANQGDPDHTMAQLADLKAVFINSDLRSLFKEGIGPDFFGHLNRPTFFRSRSSRAFKAAYYVSTALLAPSLAFAAVALDTIPFELEVGSILAILLFLLLLYFVKISRQQARARIRSASIEVSADGLLYHHFGNRYWFPWERFERIGRTGRFRAVPALIVSHGTRERSDQSKFEPRELPISGYLPGWPHSRLDETLDRFAPQLRLRSPGT